MTCFDDEFEIVFDRHVIKLFTSICVILEEKRLYFNENPAIPITV